MSCKRLTLSEYRRKVIKKLEKQRDYLNSFREYSLIGDKYKAEGIDFAIHVIMETRGDC